MRCCMIISSQQKGFLVSLAKLFMEQGHDVFFIAQDVNAAKCIKNILPNTQDDHIDIKCNFSPNIPPDIIAAALAYERHYGENFSMISSNDRALGKGYLSNADGHPDIKRSWHDKSSKFAEILSDFLYYEMVFNKFKPNTIISWLLHKIPTLVARSNNIRCFTLSGPRVDNHFYWVENEYDQNTKMIERAHLLSTSLSDERKEFSGHFKHDISSSFLLSNVRYTWPYAVKSAIHTGIKETIQMIRGSHKSQTQKGYKYLGWTDYILRVPRNHAYFLKYGKKPEELSNEKYVLFPLQVEPEISLIGFSPESNNSFEIITWISKSLPADCTLVVKEHPLGFGARSISYYNNLRRIPNVVLAHPEPCSVRWLKGCRLVSTITGTMGIEALYFLKPVLSFGKHQPINVLPSVEYADSFTTTKKAVSILLSYSAHDPDLKISRDAYNHALLEVSVDLSGFEKTFDSSSPQPRLAQLALDNLRQVYPEAFIERTGA